MEQKGRAMAKKRKTLLGKVQALKKTARGKAWSALHRAEATIARGEGRIKPGVGRPKKRKGKKLKPIK